MRALIRNHCSHCGNDFYMPCVGGLSLCYECEQKGHTEMPWRSREDCPVCAAEHGEHHRQEAAQNT